MSVYAGKILLINLKTQEYESLPLNPHLSSTYIGGRGLGIRLLFDRLDPQIDPLSADNILYIGTGPFAGTLIPSSSRTIFMAKSPLGQIGWSNAGGHFAAELKYAGYDAVLIMEQSPSPIYLLIQDDKVKFHSASHLLGKSVKSTHKQICSEQGIHDLESFIIGPAGENLVIYASIISAGRLTGKTAGRSGMGAVMGSKNLKAISVWGSKDVNTSDLEAFNAALRHFYDITSKDTAIERRRLYGTSPLVTSLGNGGNLVTRNFQTGIFEQQTAIDEQAIRKVYVKNQGCFSCIHLCTHMSKISDGPYEGLVGKKPEFETLAMLGSNIGVGRLDAIYKFNEMIDELGMDCISLGASISFAQELWQRGILTEEDTDGVDLSWGNFTAIEQLIEDIALRRTQLGDYLADGVRIAAQKIQRGSEKYAMHTKGMEIIGGDPRGQFGFALGYATCTRGGDHLGALPKADYMFDPEYGKKLFGSEESTFPQGVVGKGRMVKWYEDWKAIVDSVNICTIGLGTSTLELTLQMQEYVAEAYTAATGVQLTVPDLFLRGERIYNLERLFNLREGLTVQDDTLSQRFLKEPLAEGKRAGKVVPLDQMLSEYYKARNWNPKTGYPSPSIIEKLGLQLEIKQVRKVHQR